MATRIGRPQEMSRYDRQIDINTEPSIPHQHTQSAEQIRTAEAAAIATAHAEATVSFSQPSPRAPVFSAINSVCSRF